MSPGFSSSELVTVAVSVVALLISIGALILAFQQVKLANRQVIVAESDLRLAEGQSESTKRQEAIAVKQAEIAATQHRIMQEQLGRRAVLEVRLFFTDDDQTRVIGVTNTGNKTAQGFYWQFMVPHVDQVAIVQRDLTLRPEEIIVPYNSDPYRMRSCYVDKPLYPGRSMACATLRVTPEARHIALLEDRVGLLPYLWAVTAADGRFPSYEWSPLWLEPLEGPLYEYKPHLFQ